MMIPQTTPLRPETALCSNLDRRDGHLRFAGQDTVELAKMYGTPLYLMDEDRIRYNCRLYREAFSKCFPEGSQVLYASKAAAFRQMCRIVGDEGLGLDVVSPGEIHTARTAGFPMAQVYYHGNNKTDEDIAFAMDAGVGCFVADGIEELLALEAEAARRGVVQKVLLRITPGIDPHTYAAVSTGQVDSKFGVSIETGQAEPFVRLALEQPHLNVAGFHCHVGSQVFWEDVFERAVMVMMAFIRTVRDRCGYLPEELDLGGGYGVRYVESDPEIDIPRKIADLAEMLHAIAKRLDLPVPRILMEPGRSIVADAGMTLYTVGSVKEITGAGPQHRGGRRHDPLHRGLRQGDHGLQALRLRGRRHVRQPPLRPLRRPVHLLQRRAHGRAPGQGLRSGGPLLRKRGRDPAERGLSRRHPARGRDRRVHHGRLQLLHGVRL